jgi:ATP synthase protein I
VAGSPENKGEDDAAMRARLAALSQDLAKGRTADTKAGAASDGSSGSALNLGVRVTSEFVAAIVVGAFIGWEIDRWLHTSPGGLIIFVALGTAAGFYNVYRIATKSSGR